MSPLGPEEIAERWRAVRARVDEAARRAGRSPGEITLVAVSKTHPPEAIEAAWAAGARHFGENYAQELADKAARLARPGIAWHYIGHLQRNKVKLVAGVAALIETIDSARLLEAVAARVGAAGGSGAPQRLLLQVNVGDESQKSGAAASELPALLDRALAEPRVRVEGLMAIPPLLDDPEAVRPFFARLRALRDREAARTGQRLATLSMGMSSDFEVAIQEGATSVRVGTAIFGERPAREGA